MTSIMMMLIGIDFWMSVLNYLLHPVMAKVRELFMRHVSYVEKKRTMHQKTKILFGIASSFKVNMRKTLFGKLMDSQVLFVCSAVRRD
jgi:hypothetical protein